ncbi:MAG TPA: transaldolase [Polyangiaceae bacterium]|nr:transaldolase [Polyangiaceae bacterium]
MPQLMDLLAHGQSMWLDYIDRKLLSTGKLQALIDDGLMGLTSNPSIFEKAIAEGTDYESDLARFARGSVDAKTLYEQLASSDIQSAADAFRSVYAKSNGRDGFVSLEVSPELARDTEGTVAEARRLWRKVDRENLMIKVPGTPEGLPAIETLISEGINVNVTLLFSVSVYEKVAASFIAGLNRRAAAGGGVDRTASVASFFVSRVDSAVDNLLQARMASASESEQSMLRGLLGKAAVANAKLAYARYREIFSGEAWTALATKGAQPQRLLWASTGTKNREYSDVMYIEELIGRNTVNTAPPSTLAAFREHGRIRDSLVVDVHGAQQTIQALASTGIALDEVTQRLLDDGQRLFRADFHKLLTSLERAIEGTVSTADGHQT